MKLTLYTSTGEELFDIIPASSSGQDWSLMSDNKLSVTFDLETCVLLLPGCYVDFEGSRFYLLEEYKPTMINTSLWRYNVSFKDAASWMAITVALNLIDGQNKPIFNYTAPAAEHAAIIVANLNRRMNTTAWKVGSVIDTPNITIEYAGKYCSEILHEIVDGQKTEWWIDDMTLNIGHAEFGDIIELGYQQGLLGDIVCQKADDMRSYAYLYPVGSTRNIDPTKYGYDRLQLPDGQTRVDMNVEQGVAELVEEAAFSGIYPRYVGKVTEVSTSVGTSDDGSQFVIYFIKDDQIPFNPNDYELPGEVKHITFQSGELRGADFEVNYNNERREFEIITQWSKDGAQLPGGMLVPAVGDEYVVWNITMPDEYYPLASQEFLEAAEAFAEAAIQDASVYKAPMDYIYVQEKGLRLRPGQRVRLISDQYFSKGYYDSRVTRITRNLNNPNALNIDVSAVRVIGTIQQLQNAVKNSASQVTQISNSVQTVVQNVANAVTLTGNQRVQGVKNFIDGIRLNSSPLFTYDPTTQSWVLEGNLITTGGIAARAALGALDVPTIMDALVVDESFIVDNGVLRLNPNLDLGGLDTDELENYLTANKYATITDISSALEPYIKSEFVEKNYSSIKYVDDTFIRLAGELQTISARHDFTDGLKIGGLPIYKSQDDTIYLDCNLVVRGGITARGTNETITPSIFEALPIDGNTIKRTADGRLYVDADALNISGGGGVADSVSWENVTGKPTWIGSTKPTYTPQEIGALSITGGVVNGLVQATSFSASEWMSARFFTSDSFPVGVNTIGVCRWGAFDEVGGLKIQFGADSDTKIEVVNRQWSKSLFSIDTAGNVRAEKAILSNTSREVLSLKTSDTFGPQIELYVGDTSVAGIGCIPKSASEYFGTYLTNKSAGFGLLLGSDKKAYLTNDPENLPKTYEIIHSGNYSDYALPITGGSVTGGFTCRDNFRTHDNYFGLSVKSQGNANSWYGVKAYMQFDEGSTMGVCRIGTSFLYRGLSIGFSTGNPYNYNIPSDYSYTDVVVIRRDGNVSVGGVTADEKLHVHGNILATGGITARYTSDERLKKNLRPINAGKMILSLGRVREFEYIDSEVEKNNLYKGSHIGLIYQDVKGSALSKMCFEREDGYGSLNYWDTSLKALLVGVAQEHEIRLTKDERDIQALKEENKALRKEIEYLKQIVA